MPQRTSVAFYKSCWLSSKMIPWWFVFKKKVKTDEYASVCWHWQRISPALIMKWSCISSIFISDSRIKVLFHGQRPPGILPALLTEQMTFPIHHSTDSTLTPLGRHLDATEAARVAPEEESPKRKQMMYCRCDINYSNIDIINQNDLKYMKSLIKSLHRFNNYLY